MFNSKGIPHPLRDERFLLVPYDRQVRLSSPLLGQVGVLAMDQYCCRQQYKIYRSLPVVSLQHGTG